ncbi:MAG: hypothetical protein ABR606_19000 [Vicinamibacterales bacterium]
MLLVLASIAGQLAASLVKHPQIDRLARLVNVDDEANVPTGFSALLMLLAALLLTIVAALERHQPRSAVAHWRILAIGFLLMATTRPSHSTMG